MNPVEQLEKVFNKARLVMNKALKEGVDLPAENIFTEMDMIHYALDRISDNLYESFDEGFPDEFGDMDDNADDEEDDDEYDPPDPHPLENLDDPTLGDPSHWDVQD